MVIHMKISLDIDDSAVRRLRAEAARRGTTMSALVEAGLRCVLTGPNGGAAKDPLPPLPTWRGGEPLVDIVSRQSLYMVMGED